MWHHSIHGLHYGPQPTPAFTGMPGQHGSMEAVFASGDNQSQHAIAPGATPPSAISASADQRQAGTEPPSHSATSPQHAGMQQPAVSTMPGRVEELYILMYEMNIVGLDDVKLAQAWLQDLVRLGYRFPPLVRGEDVR